MVHQIKIEYLNNNNDDDDEDDDDDDDDDDDEDDDDDDNDNCDAIKIIRLVKIETPMSYLMLQLLATLNASTLSFLAEGYAPYSNHSFFIQLCNSVGCVNSSLSSGRTLLAGT